MNDLSERLITFAVDVIKLLRKFPSTSEYRIIINQLVKSSTSSGANLPCEIVSNVK